MNYSFTVEVVGAGFDKPANAGYFTLRFPRVLKVHDDRSFRDAVSFAELQEMAKRCLEIPNAYIEDCILVLLTLSSICPPFLMSNRLPTPRLEWSETDIGGLLPQELFLQDLKTCCTELSRHGSS